MKRKTMCWYSVVFTLLCGTFLLVSCHDDASKNEEALCPDAQVLCDNVCVALDTNTNCGACNNSCSFDRVCTGNVQDAYQCVCPTGKKDCGKDLSCSWLDGGVENPNDKRCGSCNTICASSESCEINTCVCLITAGVFLSDASGKPLTGQALSEEYLRNDANCAGCGKACLDGMHCVLGQCTKTACNADECHFPLPDGREECQPCKQICREVGAAMVRDQTPLMPVMAYVSDNSSLNKDNTSKDAYGELGSKGYGFKRATGCKCGEQICIPGASDRCDAKQCVCGVDSDVCSGLTCTSQGCKKS